MTLRKTTFGMLVLLASLLGCSRPKAPVTIHLTDGRSFTVNEFFNDGRHIFFAVNGWEYTLPSAMDTNASPVTSQTVSRVTITTNSIYTVGRVFSNMDALCIYLDSMSSPSRLILLEIPDIYLWPQDRKDDFGACFGPLPNRPYVGLEARWSGTVESPAFESENKPPP